MRRVLVFAAALMLGCASDSLVPDRVASEVSVTFSNVVGDTIATALADSVVAVASLPYGCSGTVTSQAGSEGGTLVVTVTDSMQYAVPCAYLAQYRVYRAAAGPLAPGSYPVELRFRDVVGSAATSSTLLRTTVLVP